MSYLYVCEQGANIGYEAQRFQVKYKDGMLCSIPSETVDTIEVFGKIQISTQCVTECLKRGINIIFYSTNGAYFGRLISTSHVNVQRQRRQAELENDIEFKHTFAKRIIDAKIQNQIVILRRYERTSDKNVSDIIKEMQRTRKKVDGTTSTEELMGYEGYAARAYFNGLGILINPDFAFKGRTKRPPTDPFNSMISLGYSIIMNEIYGKLEEKGLNPYFGIMHKDREKHPTLASDMMEEWRAVLIDSTAMSMINGHEVEKEDFYMDMESPGIFLGKEAFKSYVKKLENKFRMDNKYLSYINTGVSFRRALDLQMNQLVKAIEEKNPMLYKPIIIR